MALDDVLNNLTVEDNGNRVVSPNYNSVNLLEAQESLAKLNSFNMNTLEGLSDYQTLTGDDVSAYSGDMIDYRKQSRLSGGQNDMSLYIKEHFENLIDEVDEESQTRIGYTFCPNQDSENNPNDYNSTRNIVHQNNEILRSINEDPENFLNQHLENESPLIARYIMNSPEEFLKISQSDAQRTALLSIRKYGASDFLKETSKVLESQKNSYDSENSRIMGEVNSKLDDKAVELGRVLTGQERADLISSDIQSISELAERYPGAQQVGQFTGEIFKYALANIKRNLEE
tara:strand:+ start:79 stop:939 length:861 start_codon:yes stop_codon:yes gene_type:complete